MTALKDPATRPVAAVKPQALTTLQLGLNWFPEQPGGLDRYFYELMRALPRAGVACRGLVLGSSAVGEATGGQVRPFAGPGSSLLQRLRAVRKAVKSAILADEPDVFVSHFALYALPVLRLKGCLPFVVHFHGPWAAESRAEGAAPLAYQGKWQVERAVYRRADRVVCLSEAFARILREDYRLPADRIRVVSGAIDVDRLDVSLSRADARARLGWQPDRPTVLCVRRLARRMGLENLIDAAKALRQRVPDVQVLIAGRGSLRHELESRIAASALQDTVKLLGFVPDADLPFVYRAADVSVVPSVALEGFGLVAAESLAAGTPVLVTPVGGLPEVVAGLSPGLILPDGLPAALADGLARLLAGPNSNIPAAGECAQYARDRFGWPRIAALLAGVYHEAKASRTV
jgi:glycosyltransferase involved in cell wall biosynthesis